MAIAFRLGWIIFALTLITAITRFMRWGGMVMTLGSLIYSLFVWLGDRRRAHA